MNVYDTANRLAEEIRTSEEYINYKMAKQAISLKTELKKEIEEFEKVRYQTQLIAMQTGKNDEQLFKKMQEMYINLIENDEAKKYFDAENKFNILIADVNKIIGESVKDVFK